MPFLSHFFLVLFLQQVFKKSILVAFLSPTIFSILVVIYFSFIEFCYKIDILVTSELHSKMFEFGYNWVTKFNVLFQPECLCYIHNFLNVFSCPLKKIWQTFFFSDWKWNHEHKPRQPTTGHCTTEKYLKRKQEYRKQMLR